MDLILEKYLNLLWRMFEYDISKLSQPWMYYWMLVPVLFYLVFFFIKWAVLTTPIWLPIALALQPFRAKFAREPKYRNEKKLSE